MMSKKHNSWKCKEFIGTITILIGIFSLITLYIVDVGFCKWVDTDYTVAGGWVKQGIDNDDSFFPIMGVSPLGLVFSEIILDDSTPTRYILKLKRDGKTCLRIVSRNIYIHNDIGETVTLQERCGRISGWNWK